MSPEDKLFYAGSGIGALALALFVGGLIALVPLHAFSASLNPLTIPAYYWFYRSNTFVMIWLLKCTLGVIAVGGVGALLYIFRKPSLHGEARWARETEIRRERLRDGTGILLGRAKRRYLRFGGSEHVLLEAPTRAGKGVGVVIPNLLSWKDSVVVLDVKQENWELTAGFRSKKLKQRVLLFDPLDTQGRTARFNPLAYINRDDPVEVINELQKMSAMLFPPPLRGESFWADSARTAFIGVAAYVAATGPKGDDPGIPFTIGEVYRNVTVGDPKQRFPRLIAERAASERPLSPQCISALQDWTSSSDNTFTGIRQSVTARIGLWINPYIDAATSESDFDLRSFRTEPTSLYLGVTPDNIERVADLYNLLFQQLVDLNVRELPSGKKHSIKLLLLLDEFARLGRANVIATGFSFVAGYGIRLMPVIQSRSQLRAIYGKDTTDEIIANCGVELVFTPKELDMANELSSRLGNYTYRAKSRSRKLWDSFDGSVSTSDQRRALLLPQELMQFPKDELIVLRGGIPPIKGTKITFFNDRHFLPLSKIAPPPVPVRPLSDVASAAQASQRAIQAESEAALKVELTNEEIVAPATIDPARLDPKLLAAVDACDDGAALVAAVTDEMFEEGC